MALTAEQKEVCQQAVDRGAAWLDEAVPDWRGAIDITTLDLKSGCRCVMGQLTCRDLGMTSSQIEENYGFDPFDLWADGFGADVSLPEPPGPLAEYGFIAPCIQKLGIGNYSYELFGAEYTELQRLWVEKVEESR